MTPTQAERSQTTTDELLETAHRLFGDRGYAGTSIEDIVRTAGVTRGALYHHFDSKAAVFRAVFERQQEKLARQLSEAVSADSDPWYQLREGCRAFLDVCLDADFRQISLLDAPAVLGWDAVREVESKYTIAMLRQGLKRAERHGQIRPGDLDARTFVLNGALCEGGVLIARAEKPKAMARHVAAEIDLLLEGLLVTDAQPEASARHRAR